MTLRKIWTTQYQRFGRAAYAESNDVYIDVVIAQIIAVMADSSSRFYKVEVKENGAYVGFFIIQGIKMVLFKIRPHFEKEYTAPFFSLVNEVQGNSAYSSTLGSDNVARVSNT